ncbi:MAG: CotH kinase family protein [Oscillospiraceae bacterium]|nr:CotH kinase family protein [Oscillospiraceae bacterium]
MQHLSNKKENRKKRSSGRAIIIAAALIILAGVAVAVFFLLNGSKPEVTTAEPAATNVDNAQADFIGVVENSRDVEAEKTVYISEVMAKNRATVRDDDGDFPDYIELHNCSDKSVSLADWKLSDKRGGKAWTIPDVDLGPGEYLIIFADGKNRVSGELHTDFAISAGETVFLYNSKGAQTDSMTCTASQADTSCVKSADGDVSVTLYPSPGYQNTAEGYIEWQESLKAPEPLMINEVMVANYSTLKINTSSGVEYPDWAEIKNTSSSTVQLSDYYLSDSMDDLKKWRFPEFELEAGSSVIVICDPEIVSLSEEYVVAGFSLNSQEDQLYLSSSSGLIDYMPLKDIPYECSFGRLNGKNGFFYFDNPTPSSKNSGGYRYVAPSPVCLTAEGIYDDIENLEVKISGQGDVYYTLDGTVPTVESMKYSGPVNISGTTVIRAVSVIPGAMNSRTATFSYFLNENCALPVVSLVVDDFKAFDRACKWIDKTVDLPANIAFFEDGGTFNLGCTVKLTGQASLEEYLKKGMRVKFSGAFGRDKLVYDLFGEGEKEYGMLSIRTGNDNGKAYIRNELCQSLAYDLAPDMISQHGKYCVVFINGDYYGIFCLKEKINDQYIADCAGVSKSSIETETLEDVFLFTFGKAIYNDVFFYASNSDLSVQEYYEKIASQIDIDNFIDWYVIQGYCGNWDIFYRNVTFYRSDESDGKWRVVLYDLDHSFKYHEYAFNNTYRLNYQQSLMAQLLSHLLKNEEFKAKYLKRTATALNTVFTNEKTLSRIDELEQVILPEVERDCKRWGRTLKDYNYQMNELKNFIQKNRIDYGKICRNAICSYLNISEQELMSYAD